MVYFIIIISEIFLDGFTKYIVNKKIRLYEQKTVIKNFFYLTNVKNEGAALGYMKEHPKRLIIIVSAMLAALFVVLCIMINIEGYEEYRFLLAVLIGGGAGNLADRLKNGCVTDFIYIKYKKLPIFNLADLFIFTTPIITIGCLFV